MTRRRSAPIIPALLGVAAVVRLAYLLQNRHSPFFAHPIIDGAEYVGRANTILADGLLWDHVPIHAPLYPSVVAGVFASTSHSFLALYALQHVLGLVTLFLVHRVTRAAFGSTAALVALGLGALSWAPVYYEGQPLSEPLVALLLVASVAALGTADRARTALSAAVAGVLLGAAVVTRANILALVPVAAAWLAWRRPGAARATAAFLGAVAVVIAPVTVQNWRAEGDFVLVQANGAFNFFLANNPDADAGHTVRPGVEWRRLLREGDREAPGGPGARDRYWMNRGVSYAAAHPLRTVGLLGKRLALYLDGAETGTSQDPVWHRAQFPALRWAPLGAGWAMALALCGFALWRRRAPSPGGAAAKRARAKDRTGVLIALLAVTGVVSLLFFPYFSRYRAPALPLWWALAGAGAVAWWSAWSAPGSPRTLTAGRLRLGALLGGLLVFTLLDPLRLRPEPIVRIEYQLGRVAGQRGDGAATIAHYRRALARYPDDPDILNNLGLVLDLTGRTDEARPVLEAALAAAPDHVEARMNLAALDRDAGRLEEAVRGYERAVQDDPLKFDAVVALGLFRVEQGRTGDAIDLLQRAMDLRSGDREVGEMLGTHLLAERRLDEARAHFDRLTRRRSTRPVGLLGLARLEAAVGRLNRADELVRQAIALDKDYTEAHRFREEVSRARSPRR